MAVFYVLNAFRAAQYYSMNDSLQKVCLAGKEDGDGDDGYSRSLESAMMLSGELHSLSTRRPSGPSCASSVHLEIIRDGGAPWPSGRGSGRR